MKKFYDDYVYGLLEIIAIILLLAIGPVVSIVIYLKLLTEEIVKVCKSQK